MKSLLLRATISSVLAFLLSHESVNGQILEQVVSKFHTIQNLGYTVESHRKDPMSDSLYLSSSRLMISFTKNRQFIFKDTEDIKEEIYDGNKRIVFNIPDSTYNIINNTRSIDYNYKIIPNIINQLQDNLSRGIAVQQNQDSIMDGTSYYNFKLIERDSVVMTRRTFIFITVLIDKNNFLPYYYKYDSQGFIDGTSIFIKQHDEYFFKDYIINSKYFESISIEIPKYFSMQKPRVKLPLLTKGLKAPELELLDSSGKELTLIDQKGKIILLNFSLVGCPHCIESIEMLNRFYTQYSSSDFVIITIYPLDNKGSIHKQNNKFQVKYPTFTNRHNSIADVKNYHVQGYPNFYLIDKEGNIVQGFNGYSQSIGRELSELVASYLK